MNAPPASGRVPVRLSIVIPTLNEASCIGALLDDLAPLRDTANEIILVDAGSSDATRRIAEPRVDHLIETPAGRARQMNAGAALAGGTWLWFLHADSRVSTAVIDALGDVTGSGADGSRSIGQRSWGRFDVRLSGRDWRLRVIETFMNLRSRLSGIATGDQGIFVHRSAFVAVGGFPEIPLMEDIALSKRLRAVARPQCIGKARLQTSSRRWEDRGIGRTVLLMWRLRLAFALGAPAETLHRRYR